MSRIFLCLLLGDLRSVHAVGQFCDGNLAGSDVGVLGPVGYLDGIRGVLGFFSKVGQEGSGAGEILGFSAVFISVSIWGIRLCAASSLFFPSVLTIMASVEDVIVDGLVPCSCSLGVFILLKFQALG